MDAVSCHKQIARSPAHSKRSFSAWSRSLSSGTGFSKGLTDSSSCAATKESFEYKIDDNRQSGHRRRMSNKLDRH